MIALIHTSSTTIVSQRLPRECISYRDIPNDRLEDSASQLGRDARTEWVIVRSEHTRESPQVHNSGSRITVKDTRMVYIKLS